MGVRIGTVPKRGPRSGRIPYLKLFLILLVVFLPGNLRAEKRVALVIGNADYQHTTPLANPANDARAIAASLQKLNFEVVEAYDMDIDGLSEQLDRFSQKLQGADVGLFFYAGHGLSFGGNNYIVPVDAKLTSQFRLRRETIPIDEIMNEMAASARVSLLFLDACRNNPLAETLQRSIRTRTRNTSVNRGLSLMKPRGEESLIVFATEPGQVAEDGKGDHSPFTQALLNHIERPGIDIEVMLKAVQRDVKRATDNAQRPERWSKLESNFSFNPRSRDPVTTGTLRNASRPGADTIDRREEQIYWESVKDLGDVELIKAYLERYPDGRFVAIARVLVRRLENSATRPTSGPSFDCDTSSGIVERTICGSFRLSQMDARMATLYFRVKGRLTKDEADDLLKEQRSWISTRNRCRNNAPCLEQAYQERLTRLDQWVKN